MSKCIILWRQSWPRENKLILYAIVMCICISCSGKPSASHSSIKLPADSNGVQTVGLLNSGSVTRLRIDPPNSEKQKSKTNDFNLLSFAVESPSNLQLNLATGDLVSKQRSLVHVSVLIPINHKDIPRIHKEVEGSILSQIRTGSYIFRGPNYFGSSYTERLDRGEIVYILLTNDQSLEVHATVIINEEEVSKRNDLMAAVNSCLQSIKVDSSP